MRHLVRDWRNERGFTLIEMVIAMTLFTLVLASFYKFVVAATKGWASLEGQLEVQQHPRVALGQVLAEIRQSRDFMIGSGGTSLGLVKATALSQDVAAGATSFSVDDASVLATGVPMVLISLNRLEQVTVTTISGNTVTITPALTRAHKEGEVIRRAQSSLTVATSSGNTSMTVASGGAFKVGDIIAVGDEAYFTVTVITSNTLTITPSLGQSHAVGEIVQPLTVMFRLSGSQLTRCTQSCNVSTNEVVVADFLAAPTGKQLLSAVKTTLAASAAVGATQLCVQSVTGFAVNDQIQIDREAHQTDEVVLPNRRTVTAINTGTNCLTLDGGLGASRPVGSVVRVNAVEVNLRATRLNPTTGQTQEVQVTSKALVRN